MDTDKEKGESTEFMAKSQSSLNRNPFFRYETTIFFHQADTNRVSVSVRFYPCPSVKSVVQFLWMRQCAALRFSVQADSVSC